MRIFGESGEGSVYDRLLVEHGFEAFLEWLESPEGLTALQLAADELAEARPEFVATVNVECAAMTRNAVAQLGREGKLLVYTRRALAYWRQIEAPTPEGPTPFEAALSAALWYLLASRIVKPS